MSDFVMLPGCGMVDASRKMPSGNTLRHTLDRRDALLAKSNDPSVDQNSRQDAYAWADVLDDLILEFAESLAAELEGAGREAGVAA